MSVIGIYRQLTDGFRPYGNQATGVRPTLEAAIERCRLRVDDTLTDPEPISALHRQFSMLGEFENHVIESVGHGPDDTLAAVHAGLVSGRFRLNTTT